MYRHVRHPSYLGALIAFLGFSLASGNWLSMVVIMGITPCLYLYRIHEEDAALLVDKCASLRTAFVDDLGQPLQFGFAIRGGIAEGTLYCRNGLLLHRLPASAGRAVR